MYFTQDSHGKVSHILYTMYLWHLSGLPLALSKHTMRNARLNLYPTHWVTTLFPSLLSKRWLQCIGNTTALEMTTYTPGTKQGPVKTGREQDSHQGTYEKKCWLMEKKIINSKSNVLGRIRPQSAKFFRRNQFAGYKLHSDWRWLLLLPCRYRLLFHNK